MCSSAMKKYNSIHRLTLIKLAAPVVNFRCIIILNRLNIKFRIKIWLVEIVDVALKAIQK